MQTLRTINVTFQNAIAQAEKLEQSADQLRNAAKQMGDMENSLRRGWEGESASLYFRKCKELQTKMNATARDLDQIASVIRRSAKAYRETERKALEIIATDSSK